MPEHTFRLLDLFCGAGGAAMGYHRAGFTDIVGVDNRPMPRYPFTFVQADALEYVAEHGHEFDAIHASPPCQAYSVATRAHPGLSKHYPDLVAPTRAVLKTTERLYVIENVPGAPMNNALILCGTMFGLRVKRHRLFECEPPIYLAAAACSCKNAHTKVGYHIQPSFARGARLLTVAGDNYCADDGRVAMDINWMIRKELSQAIPPAYTEFIGAALMRHLRAREAT